MLRGREQIPPDGRTDRTAGVLIAGENGNGKQLVARHVHLLGQRRTGPFIEVNSAALPEELIESRCSDTSAVRSPVPHPATGEGKFDLALGGTLFLDEVGDMQDAGACCRNR